MGLDIFRLSGVNTTDYDEKDPLRAMSIAYNSLVEPPKKSKQFEQDLERASIIVEGKKLFDIQASTTQELDAAHKQAHADVKAQYVKFESEDGALKKEKLFGLHQGAAASAMLLLNENYEFKSFSLSLCEYMALTEVAYSRMGDVFSYEVTSQIYMITDEEGNYWVKEKGKLKKMEDIKKPDKLKEEGYEPIFEFSSIAKIDLTDFPDEEPITMYEVQVKSHSSKFKYKGPFDRPEIVQAENISWVDKIQKLLSNIKHYIFGVDLKGQKLAEKEKSSNQSLEGSDPAAGASIPLQTKKLKDIDKKQRTFLISSVFKKKSEPERGRHEPSRPDVKPEKSILKTSTPLDQSPDKKPRDRSGSHP